jgi:hypothetical protein
MLAAAAASAAKNARLKQLLPPTVDLTLHAAKEWGFRSGGIACDVVASTAVERVVMAAVVACLMYSVVGLLTSAARLQ